jgi:hypothetical protein
MKSKELHAGLLAFTFLLLGLIMFYFGMCASLPRHK